MAPRTDPSRRSYVIAGTTGIILDAGHARRAHARNGYEMSDSGLRSSGIDLVGDVPWGTHLCQFYETARDLTDLLVPYFKAGLESNEFCMWVTSDPLTAEAATAALTAEVPDLAERIAADQMVIIPHSEWYMLDGYFDMDRVFAGWIGKLEDALAAGFEGLRATGNTAWLEDRDWDDFTQYEETLNNIIGGYRMMAICTYSLGLCGAREIIDVVVNHQFALIKREGKWEIIEGSERRKAREDLAMYKQLADSTSEAIAVTDSEMRLTYVNEAYSRLLGADRDSLLGRRPRDFAMTDQAVEQAVPEIDGAFASGGSWTGEIEVMRSDGACVPVLASIATLYDTSSARAGTVGVFRDIAERKAAEEEQARLVHELDAYARGVSHDLRGPLASALLANTCLADSCGEMELAELREEVLECTGHVRTNLERAFTLARDLLALAQSGQRPDSIEDVDVAALVDEIVAERSIEIAEAGVEVEVAEDLGAVRANRTQIYQLFSNVIRNAIMHNDCDNPVVRVERIASAAGSHAFRVSDNGSGIPEESLEKIFRPFYRSGESSDTGLGLSIARKVAETYGGDIRAYNENGACFEFTLKGMEPEPSEP